MPRFLSLPLILFLCLPTLSRAESILSHYRVGSHPLKWIAASLEQVNRVPADIEVLFSDAIPLANHRLFTNPFGHIAVAVRGQVHTTSVGQYFVNRQLIVANSLAEYLYGVGVERGGDLYEGNGIPGRNQRFFGVGVASALARNVWGIRIRGLAPAQIQAVERYYAEVNRARTGYRFPTRTCSTHSAEALKQAGIRIRGRGMLPRHVVDDVLQHLDREGVKYEVVLYQQVPTKTRPLSFQVPLLRPRTLSPTSWLRKRVDRVVTPDPVSGRLQVVEVGSRHRSALSALTGSSTRVMGDPTLPARFRQTCRAQSSQLQGLASTCRAHR